MPDARVAKLSREYDHSRAQTERDLPRGRGGYINYYKDLGMSTTEEGHDAFVAAKKKYNSQISAAKKKISDYQSQVDQYEIPSRDNILKLAYQNALSTGTVPVKVVNNNQVEGTYRVPREYADSLKNTKGLYTNEVNGTLYVDVKVKGGRYRGEELHTGLGQQMAADKKSVYEKAGPYADRVVADANNQYKGALASLTAAKEQVAGYEQLNKEQLNALRTEYQRREKALKEIYDSIYVKDAEGEEDNGPSTVYSAIAAANAAEQSAPTTA